MPYFVSKLCRAVSGTCRAGLWGVVISGIPILCADSMGAGELVHQSHGWSRIEGAPQRASGSPVDRPPHIGAQFRLDTGCAQAILKRAPKRERVGKIHDGVEWSVPMPDGRMERFLIVESAVMAPELAARFPEIKTYRGIGLQNGALQLRLDYYRGRFHAQVRSPQGHAYVDPTGSGGSDYVVCAAGSALRSDEESFECLTATTVSALATMNNPGGGTQSDGQLRLFRLAVAATAEYTHFHGGTVEAGLAAIVTAVNRLNGIYESELGVGFILVANNDRIVFTDPATDPYSNTDALAMLSQNQSALDALIGSANYDVGHVLATGGGGLAQLSSVCVGGWKARGVTGRASPVGDSYYVDYFAHEIGHQFGAHHTFNGISGSCNVNNRHPEAAFEPGSGSTIMSYSGICGADNLQHSSDSYFHSATLLEIRAFLQTTCAVPQPSGNGAPWVDAGVDRIVPVATPFVLNASGGDPDGDVPSYCWEQIDLGNAEPLDGQDHGSGPLFRWDAPWPASSRHFPRLDNVLLNIASPAEVLPAVARPIHFRVTARDQHAGAGAWAMDETLVTVTTNAGPFVVLSPNAAVEWSGNQIIAWDVAGTDLSPVGTLLVDILLSTNGGYDFPMVLAQATPNDGSETVKLPDVSITRARIKIQASDNVFFDVSDVDFTIVPGAGSGLAVVTETHRFTNAASVLIPAVGSKGNASVFPLSLTVSGVDGEVEEVAVSLHGLTHSFLDDLDILLVGPCGQTVLLLSDASGGAAGSGLVLSFSDRGAVFPNGGYVVSGDYQPVNVGSTGDTFPIAVPYGSAMSAFREQDPNGVWSLYLVDDATGDAGRLTEGWSMNIQTRRTVMQTNQPPTIAPKPRQYVHAGALLVVTNEVVDPDGDGSLTFALRPDAPAGAVLNPSGVLTWTPAPSLSGTTHHCGLIVTDSGTPAMTVEAEFEVVVVGPPVLSSLRVTNGIAHLSWSSVPSGSYRVECSEDLAADSWTLVGDGVDASGFTAETACPAGAFGQRFFRVMVER